MFNKTLSRPMFRRGGRAGGGIMTGVDRPGYDGESTDTQLVTEPTKVEQIGNDMTAFNKAFPSYNNAGSDFFMNLGSNILTAPGGQPILQTLGTAAKDPLLQMQKTNMANTQGNRELALKFWQSMDDDDKDAMINRAEQMVEAGRFKTVEEALQVLVPTYSKDEGPAEILRKENIRAEQTEQSAIEAIKSQYKNSSSFSEGISDPDARTIYNFQKNISEKKYKVYHDPNQLFIDDSEVGRKPRDDIDKRLVIKDYNPEQSDYIDGRVYVDFISEIAYVKQGQFFIPYTDYISETIKTD
jgi:hypothetical protein